MNEDRWTPLWGKIIRSSLWRDTKDVRILFVTMLALKNADGKVYGKLHWLAEQAKLTLDETKEALRVLSSPDRTVDPGDKPQPHEGRRIEELPDSEPESGWQILNHDKYQKLMKQIAERNRKARWARKKRQDEIDAAIAARNDAKAAQLQRLSENRTFNDLGGTPEKYAQAGPMYNPSADPSVNF